jgi:hypothetical protein
MTERRSKRDAHIILGYRLVAAAAVILVTLYALRPF